MVRERLVGDDATATAHSHATHPAATWPPNSSHPTGRIHLAIYSTLDLYYTLYMHRGYEQQTPYVQPVHAIACQV